MTFKEVWDDPKCIATCRAYIIVVRFLKVARATDCSLLSFPIIFFHAATDHSMWVLDWTRPLAPRQGASPGINVALRAPSAQQCPSLVCFVFLDPTSLIQASWVCFTTIGRHLEHQRRYSRFARCKERIPVFLPQSPLVNPVGTWFTWLIVWGKLPIKAMVTEMATATMVGGWYNNTMVGWCPINSSNAKSSTTYPKVLLIVDRSSRSYTVDNTQGYTWYRFWSLYYNQYIYYNQETIL